MLGLAVLFFIGAFLLASLRTIKLAAWWARRNGRRGWTWTVVTALAKSLRMTRHTAIPARTLP
ncbi:hypothetical protein E5198_04200 [Pseudomonas sp. A-1]|jgi:hypothetical protein|uniref:hypothetical protein n=1 Tax=unclassified Pseudomonas TaxID=196821 RepID=UPI0010A5D956|nr:MULTISPECIES: hypothetical protein [unclassified Pseudomonas]THG85277.1 hypothetical protein E5198_04200 [Pseudomonas sp. A-1]WPP47518.1 hypothetical protein SK095_09145 [Pseudomonas sp. AN-1]